MNAKKIMGAVLVALLAAALFVGAGAAVDKGTAFVYQEDLASLGPLNGTWTNGAVAVTIGTDGVVTPGADFVVGTYTKGEDTLYITYPTATISGVAGQGISAYPFIGANLFEDESVVTITNASLSAVANVKSLYVTFPNATQQLIDNSSLEQYLEGTPALGKYTVQAVFDNASFVTGAPADILIGAPVTFTVVEAGSATIEAAASEVLKSEPILLTITGQPGKTYNVTYDANDFILLPNQLYLEGVTAQPTKFEFEMPNTGKVTIAVKANTSNGDSVKSTEKIGLTWWNDKEKAKYVTISFAKGTITAKTDAASYFIGDEVTISGTSTAGSLDYYYINGTNFKMATPGHVSLSSGVTKTGDNFEFKVNTGAIASASGKMIDVGTYTLTIVTDNEAKVTVPLVLKQPFISIISAPEVIVQGEDEVEFIINAEATEEIAYYIFGTNYFVNDSSVKDHVKDAENEDIENQFKIVLGESDTEGMDAGQYFMVVQHPMYDTKFNILSEEQAVWLNTSGQANASDSKTTKLFNVDLRQTANAAQALCDALDTQNIDDMYVKLSFFVVGEDESFTISEIPTTIAQGETLTISGVSTSNAEEYVTVEMISTAFAAVPKENVGSAAFIAVTTQVAEDGTWEVTFDTSNLNVDEYSLKVACGEDTWKNVNINVVEGAETPDTPDTPDVPDTPDTPDTPTEPTTPGFGALAALAGLGAVAVLLLRRE